MGKLYIQEGSVVDAGWVDQIAVSSDGVTWSSIQKAGLSVTLFTSKRDKTRYNALDKIKGTEYLITLSDGKENGFNLQFNPNDVANQATWLGDTIVKARVAVDDISTWIAT